VKKEKGREDICQENYDYLYRRIEIGGYRQRDFWTLLPSTSVAWAATDLICLCMSRTISCRASFLVAK